MYWLAIGIGAAIGACVRAWLSELNTAHSVAWLPAWLPAGTLLANVVGGFLIGMALWVLQTTWLPTGDWSKLTKDLLITGFLGGLTTFSTFGGEVFMLLHQGQPLRGLLLMGLHMGLTLLAVAAGYYGMQTLVGYKIN